LAVLRAAEDRPGATSAEIATVSGVQGSTLHALLARLVKNGELQKETLRPGRTGYALAQAQPEESAASAAPAGDAT
jgi:DNA-binding IclR family transcriptional regulator